MGSKLDKLFGRTPVFSKVLPVGQLYYPNKERVEEKFRQIFENRYYNNNGPLQEELESNLRAWLEVKHAICVTNATLGLMIVADCFKQYDTAFIPSFTFPATLQSILWSGKRAVLCDIDKRYATLNSNFLKESTSTEPAIIVPVNIWGGCSDIDYFEQLADRGYGVVYDSAQAFGVEFRNKKLGGFGSAEIFSFHATKIINAAEGGVITTNNDTLAAQIRAKRPTYELNPDISDRVANTRFSESQAALALLSLEDYEQNCAKNKQQFDLYRAKLDKIPGIEVWNPINCTNSNYSVLCLVINQSLFGISRNQLMAHLTAENIHARRYFHPKLHSLSLEGVDTSSSNFHNCDYFAKNAMQLPLGGQVKKSDIEIICSIIKKIHQFYLK